MPAVRSSHVIHAPLKQHWSLKRAGTASVPHGTVQTIVQEYKRFFNVHGSVYRKNILIYIQQDAT